MTKDDLSDHCRDQYTKLLPVLQKEVKYEEYDVAKSDKPKVEEMLESG